MSRDTLVHWLAGWLGMAVLAVANGALREAVVVPWVGEGAGQWVSTAVLLLVITLFARWLHHRWPLPSDGAALALGVVWAAMTVVFEFAVGSVAGRDTAEVLAQYDITEGRAWVLVPLWVVLLPTVARRLGGPSMSRHPDALTDDASRW